MNTTTYQQAAARTLNTALPHDQLCTVSGLGFVDEAVELMALFFDSAEVPRHLIIKEAGDVYWYGAALLTLHGMELERAMMLGSDALHGVDGTYGWDDHEWAMAIVISAKEVGETIKKVYGHDHPLEYIGLAKSIGAVLYQVDLLCQKHAITQSEVLAANVTKLLTRYPDGFSPKHSMARVDEVEHG